MGQYNNKQSSIIPMNELDKIPSIIFTRYLYVKDEVKLSIITSLLDKKEKALFWAYELYYSGFEYELFNLLWKVYFDFYYTLNPTFYDYFVKKQKEWIKLSNGEEKNKIISTIVSNLLIRPHNLDVFLLRQITANFEININDSHHIIFEKNEFIKWLNDKDYIKIAEFVLHQCKEKYFDELLNIILNYFKIEKSPESKIKKNIKTVKTDKRHMILAYIMLNFTISHNLKMGKKLYMIIDEKEIIPFETIYSDYKSSFYPYKILPKAYMYSIDEDNYLSLFKLQRNAINLHDAYMRHWEYYAAYSPVWFERIKKHKGTINHETKKIEFPDDDSFEEFYNEYNYETDELKMEIQNKSIQKIIKIINWAEFYEKNKSGLFVPDIEYLSEFGEIEY